MKKLLLLSIVAISLFFCPLWAQEKGSLDLNKVSIPKGFGIVKEVYQPPGTAKRFQEIIFHIQDVHANYEAQKNLANILEYLIQTYGLNLILVEGGITDKDFSYIRTWAGQDERKKKADSLLREGVITGETYVDIATDFPLKFQGIEDKELYEENMQIYLKVDSFRTEALEIIQKFKDAVLGLKKFIYTRRLKEFDEYTEDYKLEKIEFVKYLEYLEGIFSEENVDLKIYPNFLLLLKTAHLEEEIDFNRVEKERDNLVNRLSSILPKENLNKLVVMSLQLKEGKISDGEFYSNLRDIAVQNKIGMDGYKNLDRYVDYITSYEELKNEELFKEINKIENTLSDLLCKNDEQKILFKISKDLSVLESLLRLKLDPEDFDYYNTNKKDFNLNDWKVFLGRHSERFRLRVTIPQDTSIIDKNLDLLEDFYGLAFKRDEAFIRNSLDKMRKEKERLAVLIAGGFHTKNLIRLFKANNISYIVITPKLIQKTDDLLYDRILKESYKTRIWDKE